MTLSGCTLASCTHDSCCCAPPPCSAPVQLHEVQSPRGEITGTASYRERMMLPPGSTLEVTLEDVSRADAPADVIARAEVEASKAPPYAFTLAYDPARINSNHRYNVRARIMADDKLMLQSDAGYAVLGSGNVTKVDILLKRASEATASASAPAQNLRGMGSYMADAGWFVDCRSGVRLAVAQGRRQRSARSRVLEGSEHAGRAFARDRRGQHRRSHAHGRSRAPAHAHRGKIRLGSCERRLFRTVLQRAAPEHLLEAHDAEQRFRRGAGRHS